MSENERLRVAILTPHHDTKPTPHCARINDALNVIAKTNPEVKMEILAVSSLGGSGFIKLKRLLRRSADMIDRSDLVHIVGFMPAFPLLSLMARKRPTIVGPNITGASFPKNFLNKQAIHALELEIPGHWKRWYFGGGALREAVNVRFLAGAERVLTLSDYASDIVAARGYPRPNLHVLPFAAPLFKSGTAEALGISQSVHPRIVYVGRLDKRKGFDIFLELVKTLRQSASFHVFGDGPLKIDAKELAGDEKRLVLHGKKSREELLKHLPHMDLYVQPSTYEAIATTVFEALRAGVPVLSSDIAAHQEAAKTLPGIRLYDGSDLEDAKAQLSDIVETLEVAKGDAQKAGEMLDPSVTAKWLVRLYKEVAGY